MPSPGALPRKRPRRRPGDRATALAAAIDLGTNNCRLLIAAARADGELRVVDSFSRIVRLGEGLGASGEISQAALDRTVAALKICAARIRKSGASRVRAIATHASRNAGNAPELVSRVASEAGLDLEIVSAEEEARLAAVGCSPLIGHRARGALIFDVGGGSTEVIWMERSAGAVAIRHAASIPVGVVAIAESRGTANQDRAWFERVRAEVVTLIAPARAAMNGFDAAAQHLLGTSGTVTTLAGVALGLARYARARVDGSWHDCSTIMAVVDRIVAMSVKERAALGCIGADRADLIVPGCAIFAAIHTLWPCAQLRVADRGLREGILRELLLEARA